MGYVSVFWLQVMWVVLVGSLGQALRGWGVVMSVFVVSLDYLC